MSAVIDAPVLRTPPPPPPAGSRVQLALRLLVAAVVLLTVVLVGNASLTEPDGLGLLRALPWVYWAGTAVLVVALVHEVALGPRASGRWYAAYLTALVVLLHGLPGLVEANPRFPVAYVHVGFADQIATDGSLLPLLDARFSWPSFFAGAGLVQTASGGALLYWLISWTPAVINLLAAALIPVLGRLQGVSVQRCRLAALIYVLFNWVGQDYFAPQALAYVVHLVLVVTALLVFPGTGPRHGPGLAARLRARAVPRVDLPAHVRLRVLIAMFAAAAVLVTYHQITPVFLALSLVLLHLVGATGLRALGPAIGVMVLGWLSYGAEAYWRGHLDVIFGSAGRVGELLYQNVGKRTGGGAERALVVASRLGLTGLLLAAAAVAVLVLWRRRSVPAGLAVLVLAPFPMLLVQAYGGEMLLRVFFFALPAAALLVAELLGSEQRWGRLKEGCTALVLVLVLPFFVMAKYGNETFERVTTADLGVLDTLYRDAPDGSLVFTLNTITVQSSQRVGEVRFRALNPLATPEDVVDRVSSIGDRRAEVVTARYVFVSEAQEAQGVQLSGLPPGWSASKVDALLASGSFVLLERRGSAALLQYVEGQGQ